MCYKKESLIPGFKRTVHKKMIEGALRQLSTDRANYFGDVANTLEKDARTEADANMAFSVLRDVMIDLPIYIDKSDLIDMLFDFIDKNHSGLRNVMYSPSFVHDPSIMRTVTGLFVHDVVNKTLEMAEAGDPDSPELSVHKLTWPYRETDVIDPDDEPEEWAAAVTKADNWDGVDRRASGVARIDDVAAENVRENVLDKERIREKIKDMKKQK